MFLNMLIISVYEDWIEHFITFFYLLWYRTIVESNQCFDLYTLKSNGLTSQSQPASHIKLLISSSVGFWPRDLKM